MIDIVTIETPSLGDRGYLATDGTVAVVVDAQRDFDRILAAARRRSVTITHVLETHIHNDYVTGGLALARAVGAQYLVNGADRVSFDRRPVADGDVVEAGGMRIQVIGTPGHTFTHLAYALADADQVVAVFTGGSLLNGSTGRTDLLGDEHKVTLSRAQYQSAWRLASELPDTAGVLPTHGFGSFCSATPASGLSSTIGDEKRANPALTTAEEQYVQALLAGLDVYPAYYAHMAPANSAGPPAPDLSPPGLAEPAELRRRIEAGEWIVDLRERSAFAAGHLRGSLNFGLGVSMATYLGWLIPRGTPLTLLGSTPADVAEAQRELVRIGIDRPAAAAAGPPRDWAGREELEAYPTADFAAVAAELGRRPLVLLDVRRQSEWDAAHLRGAVHIPLHELDSRIGDIPAGQVWVHCQGGYRASIAASLLAARGRDVVAILDDFERSGQAAPRSSLSLDGFLGQAAAPEALQHDHGDRQRR